MVTVNIVRIAALGAAVMLTSCASRTIIPLAKPTQLESFCPQETERQYARTTSMGSILSSIYDEPLHPGGPTLAAYRAGLKSTGGAVAHYSDLEILKPALAGALGETGSYVAARTVVFSNELSGTQRWIYVELRDHGTFVWRAVRVADLQNICNEGKQLM